MSRRFMIQSEPKKHPPSKRDWNEGEKAIIAEVERVKPVIWICKYGHYYAASSAGDLSEKVKHGIFGSTLGTRDQCNDCLAAGLAEKRYPFIVNSVAPVDA